MGNLLGDFVADNLEFGQGGATEGSGDGAVGGVAADGHEDAADAWNVMAGIASPPAGFEINFKPGAEVHGRRSDDDADVAEVAGGVTRGNIQGAAEGDGQMLEVAADADAFSVDAERGANGIGELVAEDDLAVNPVTNRLNTLPAFGKAAEEFGGGVRQKIDFAVAAIHQKLQDVLREIFNRNFACTEILLVGQTGIFDQRGIVKANLSWSCYQAACVIPETVLEFFDVYRWIGVQLVRLPKILCAGGMDIKQGNHGNIGGCGELEVVTETNQHNYNIPLMRR